MNKSELTAFFMDDNKIPEGFIKEFEINKTFQDKGLLSFDGELSRFHSMQMDLVFFRLSKYVTLEIFRCHQLFCDSRHLSRYDSV